MMATVGMVGYPPRQIRQHQPCLKPHLYELDHATLLDGIGDRRLRPHDRKNTKHILSWQGEDRDRKSFLAGWEMVCGNARPPIFFSA
jgi:hypothetical protein